MERPAICRRTKPAFDIRTAKISPSREESDERPCDE
jgi:hypothetical protein